MAKTKQRPASDQPTAMVPVKAPIVTAQRGLVLTTLDEMWRFAQYAVDSGLAPKSLNNNTSAVLLAIQLGLEVGLTPMASLQNIAVINGRPSIWGDAMLAVCRASGVFDEEVYEETITGQGDAMFASCTVGRLPNGNPQTRTFSVADAKTANLWGQNTWKLYPKRMLQMRARSWALRDVFADYLRGMRAAEEQMDCIDVESFPVEKQRRVSRSSLNDAPVVRAAPPAPAPSGSPSADQEPEQRGDDEPDLEPTEEEIARPARETPQNAMSDDAAHYAK